MERASSTDDLVRHILLAQAMLPEYAERFRGLSDDELDALADSFPASCVPRSRLGDLLMPPSRQVRPPHPEWLRAPRRVPGR